MSATLTCREIDSVLVITLDRPQVKNAINREMADSLADAFDRLDADDNLKAGVLTGEGPDFCAGMDLKAFADGSLPETRGRGLAGLTRMPPSKPLIAAVEGHAVAGGFELVLACDLVIASETSRFGLPEVKRGLIAAGGGIVRLTQMIPRNRAAHLLLTGDTIPVDEAKEIGIVNSITSTGMAAKDAIDLAHRISGNAPLAVARTKELFTASMCLTTEQAFDMVDFAAPQILSSNDAREGATAFREKRVPIWSGS